MRLGIDLSLFNNASLNSRFGASPILGLDGPFDYVVDPNNGDDAADGSPATPFETLDALVSALNALTDSEDTANCLVKSGTYTDQDINLTFFAGTATIACEPGTIIEWTLGTDNSAIQPGGITDSFLTFYGNGCIIRGFDTGTGNALGAFNNRLDAYDVYVSDCVDGVSAHGTARINVYRSSFATCSKASVAHINTSVTYHEDCIFYTYASSTIYVSCDGTSAEFVNCTFDPTDGGSSKRIDGVLTLNKCILGGLSTSLVLAAEDITITDSFINVTGDLNNDITLTRCFGKASLRLRNGSDVVNITDSVLTGGVSGLLYTNYDPGSFQQVIISGSIVTNYSTAINFVNSTRAGYWNSASSSINNCAFFGNSDDFDASAEDEIGTTITNISTSDPGIGSANTLVMRDYANAGGVYGFTAAESKRVGATLNTFS